MKDQKCQLVIIIKKNLATTNGLKVAVNGRYTLKQGYTQDSFFLFFIQKVQKEGTKHCVDPYYKKVITWNVSSHEEEKCK
jgi:hypothetical protein